MPWTPIVGRGFTRDEIGQYVSGVLKTAWSPSFPVLHNTAAPRLDQWHSVPGADRMRNLASYYQSKGWSRGPHFFVADDLIWAFTPITTHGVHSPSWNGISVGVEMVGDYSVEPFNQGKGANVRDNAVALLTALCRRYRWQSGDLKLHKEDPLTTHKDCPGLAVSKADMIRRIHESLANT